MAGVFHVREDKTLVEMQPAAFVTEDEFQDLLARFPRLLGDGPNSEPRRWLLITREMGVPREEGAGGWWSLDHLFLDHEGVPTLVEVKRSADPRLRREVVGQMLDYAANAVVYWPLDAIREAFEARCEREQADPAEELERLAGGEVDRESFWQRVKSNLQAGRVRMIFVADRIPPELQRIVEFLNGQMDPAEVLAVELQQYAGEGLRTIVPRVLGQSAETAQRKQAAPAVGTWTEESVIARIRDHHDTVVADATSAILEWARRAALHIEPGKGPHDASVHLRLPGQGKTPAVLIIYSYVNGPKPRTTAELQFEALEKVISFSTSGVRLELRERARRIPGIDAKNIDSRARTPIDLQALVSEDSLNQLLSLLNWILDQIRAAR